MRRVRMLISAAGTELSTAAAAQQSRYRTPQSGARRQQTSTAVLATETLPCATTGPQQWKNYVPTSNSSGKKCETKHTPTHTRHQKHTPITKKRRTKTKLLLLGEGSVQTSKDVVERVQDAWLHSMLGSGFHKRCLGGGNQSSPLRRQIALSEPISLAKPVSYQDSCVRLLYRSICSVVQDFFFSRTQYLFLFAPRTIFKR